MKKLSKNENINLSIEKARGITCFCVCAIHFGFEGILGEKIHAILMYAVPFFFIVSGYFVYDSDLVVFQKKLKQRIKKYTIIYMKAAVIYSLLSILDWKLKYGNFIGIVDWLKRTSIFEIIVDNTWPFELGGPIWYISALVYTYIILYFLCKNRLVELCLPLSIFFLFINSVFTELYGIWGDELLFTGNFFTRGIPFVFLGVVIKRNVSSVVRISNITCVMFIILGIVLPVLELSFLDRLGILVYQGYFVGNFFMAIGLFVLCIKYPFVSGKDLLFWLGNTFSFGIYLVHQPIGELINEWLVIRLHIEWFWGNFKAFTVFVISFLLLFFYKLVCVYIAFYKGKNKISGENDAK
ncbi:acyltransferase family protein [Pseudobutyrivibrio sp. MD2005]|uniref:acyltransferase family protein n=1 Tax=Pseudobutyrivibrio sp. MD2005 TaxID=1410616 RepID=UPI00047FC785|nr:acyltransferase [Pseudobutyrivibrio sp. MD2005]